MIDDSSAAQLLGCDSKCSQLKVRDGCPRSNSSGTKEQVLPLGMEGPCKSSPDHEVGLPSLIAVTSP